MPNKKVIVKVRKEGKEYYAYFIEIRRFLVVDNLGAKILKKFFNEEKEIKDIAKILKSKEEDISNFLKEVKNELVFPYFGGYPIIEKEIFDAPIAVEINLITKCNLRCKHCCQPNYNKIMGFEKVKKILRILNKKNIFEVNLTGGEIFLHPKISEIIKLCCDKYRFATTIITNGTLLTEAFIKKIAKFTHLLSFVISLEGLGHDNDIIRGKGVFKKVDKTIKKLRKFGFHVEISTTINNSNVNNLNKLIKYAQHQNVPINFNLFKPFKPEQKSLIINPKEYFKFIDFIFRLRKKSDSNIGLTNAAIASFLTNKKKRKTCRAALSGLNINVEGKMVPCAYLGEIGYYKDKDLPEFNSRFLLAWRNNRIFKKFRKENLNECVACSYIFSGSLKGKDPYGLKAFKEYSKNIKV